MFMVNIHVNGRLQLKYEFASKVDKIFIDLFMLEQYRIFYVLIFRTSSSHFNGPHPYTPRTSSLKGDVLGV